MTCSATVTDIISAAVKGQCTCLVVVHEHSRSIEMFLPAGQTRSNTYSLLRTEFPRPYPAFLYDVDNHLVGQRVTEPFLKAKEITVSSGVG